MFFFFEDQNPAMSNMAFETYVVFVLRDYLKGQGKGIQFNEQTEYCDAILPNGIDDIPGPVFLEVKSAFSNKSGYFRSIEKSAAQIRDTDPGTLLIVLGTEFSEASKDSMVQLAQSRAKKKVIIWDLSEFNEKTKDFQYNYKDYIERPTKTIVEEVINFPTSEEKKEKVKKSLVESLKRKYQHEELSLFLGAGVSVDAGIPKWSELINSLLSEMILRRASGEADPLFSEYLNEIIRLAYQNKEDSPITQMRYIRGAFSTDEYLQVVHDVLYKNNPKPSTVLLNAIAEICAPRRNHIGVQGIVTYNFDDLLERCLKKRNIPTNTLSCESDITDPEKLSIFHVHGFLPKRKSGFDENVELIFSEEDYHRVYRDAYCWSNLAQLNYLRERTCLFIGCSLTDPNLRRLLDVATRSNEKPRHYAFLRRNTSIDAVDIDKDAIMAYKNIDMELREKYYATLGLNIIWIDNYEDIPRILESFLT